MGTSSSYKPPTKGNWGKIKKDLSSIAKSPSFPKKKALGAIGKFISEKGGGGSSTKSAHGNWTRASKETSKRIAGFVSDVGRFGFREALNRQGLGNLIEKPAKEIIAGLIDYFGGNGNTRDEINACRAVDSTMDKFMKEADTSEKIESIFNNLSNPDFSQEFLLTFLGYNIFEQFCSNYEEFLNSKMKDENSELLINNMKTLLLLLWKINPWTLTFLKWIGKEKRGMTLWMT